ncbi:hypothetical protein [Kitasatospora purpeofusca]|uniref:hypothetical protein n=1 Tax=Kitasatospora purpeofusca TaxID=67352 RepID=UPI003F4AE6B9
MTSAVPFSAPVRSPERTGDAQRAPRELMSLLGEGQGAAAPPPGALADEVGRLVAHADDRLDGIVTRPDRRLADRIEEMSGRR